MTDGAESSGGGMTGLTEEIGWLAAIIRSSGMLGTAGVRQIKRGAAGGSGEETD